MTISQVTATLADISGATTEAHLSVAEAFGTTRMASGGRIVSTGLSLTGLLATANDIAVRVRFTDNGGREELVEASAGVRLDLTGDWSGVFVMPTRPIADWSVGRAALVQSGDSVTGELVSRDEVRFTLTGSVFSLSIGGMILRPTDLACSVNLRIRQFEFRGGRAQRLSGSPMGRCPGTVGGAFELRRTI